MLNPLSRHKSNRSSDVTSDFEGPLSTDTTSYIGKKKFFFMSFPFALLIVNDIK